MHDGSGDLLQVDTVVGHRYRVIRHVGDRGFGQVYVADDSAMDMQVALMRLDRAFAHPRVRESFFETRSTAAVNDPRIVDLSDYGEDLDGRLFLVMPWVEGATALGELLERGPLPWQRTKRIAEQIAGALAAAHAVGVLHGGLEPARVFVDADDGVHVVDFGLAPALTRPGGRPLTNASPLPGNMAYLSPEQLRGEGVDARSDIYALGVLLWELLTGAPPFVGDPMVVRTAHLEQPLPTLEARDAPTEIEALLQLALAKDKDERVGAAEFVALLESMPSVGSPRSRAATAAPAPPAPAPPPAPHAAQPTPPPPPAPSTTTALADVRDEAAIPQPIGHPNTHELTPTPTPIQPPPRKRRLGKIELAIIVFLGFDALVFAAWKLLADSEPAADTVASSEPAAEPEPDAAAESEPASRPSAKADPEPDGDGDPKPEPKLSVHEAVAAELPPEPDSPGPTRPRAPSLSDKDFREAMVEAREDIVQHCLDSRMRRTLKVALKVAPSGEVEYARVVGELGDTNLGRCVVKRVYRIEFPPTHTGGTHTYTLRLR